MPSKGFSRGGRELALLRHSADILIEVGLDGRLLYVSEAAHAILGRSARSLTGLSFMEVVIPDDRAETLSYFQKIVETGAEPIFQLRVMRADGLSVRLEAATRTWKEADGTRRISASCRDVTQRSAEGAVDRARNANYRAIAEFGPHPAAIANTEGHILFSNRRFQTLFRRAESLETISRRMSDGARHAAATAWLLSTQGDGNGSTDFDTTDDEGQTIWLSATWRAFKPTGTDDEERHYSILFKDITRRKAAEEALQLLAGGLSNEGTQGARRLVSLLSRSLELDRLVFGRLDRDCGDRLEILAAWQDGEFLEDETLDLTGLPDAAVARGEACIHPAGLHQLMPSVESRLGPGFESYAGLPIQLGEGRVVGLIAGYARKPIRDTQLTRSLLDVFATHAAARLHRRAADEEIRANEDRFAALAHHSHDLLIELDQEGRMTFVSDACRSILGYQPQELIGGIGLDLMHPEDPPEASRSVEELLAGGDYPSNLTRVRHADGSWRWLESRMSPYTASDGSPRALVLSRDVTRQRHEEIERKLLYNVVQQGSDLVVVCEQDTTVIYANAMATRLLESAGDGSLEGRPFLQFLDPDAGAKLREEILPDIEEARGWSGKLELICPIDGSTLVTEATIFLFRGGRPARSPYLAITLRDVTERIATETALRETEDQLRKAQKMEAVGRLAGGIAHDFNNLLTAIIGYSDLVLDALGPDHGARRDAEEILSAAERAGGLTRQLLAFSRRQILQPEIVDLNAVVADMDRLLRRLIGEDIEVVTIQDGELERITADPSQIEQVIVNLVVNARDAMPHGGRLEIETRNLILERPFVTGTGLLDAGGYVVLRVSDDGTGMDEATLERIFEPFFSTKTPERGTGLGLATVYGIVSQSSGQIDIESSPGQGTTFRIYLPRATEASDADTTLAGDSSRGGTETVLVVEDSEVVRALVQRTLEASGYTVLTAESATGALRHCSRHPGPIDLLLTDVVLPKTDGPEIARRALGVRPDLAVLYMSGFTDETLIQHGISPDERRLLAKPFSPASLQRAVRDLLDAREAERNAGTEGTNTDPFPVEQVK